MQYKVIHSKAKNRRSEWLVIKVYVSGARKLRLQKTIEISYLLSAGIKW